MLVSAVRDGITSVSASLNMFYFAFFSATLVLEVVEVSISFHCVTNITLPPNKAPEKATAVLFVTIYFLSLLLYDIE